MTLKIYFFNHLIPKSNKIKINFFQFHFMVLGAVVAKNQKYFFYSLRGDPNQKKTKKNVFLKNLNSYTNQKPLSSRYKVCCC
jgi:hypothetical protein